MVSRLSTEEGVTGAEGYFRHTGYVRKKRKSVRTSERPRLPRDTRATCRGYDQARTTWRVIEDRTRSTENKPLISSGLGELGMCEYLTGNFIDAERLIENLLM